MTLIYEGKINYEMLKKSKIDTNDLLSMLREKGYFDVNDVAYAIFETSGELSVLPKGNQRPVVIEDIDNEKVKPSSLSNVLIVDGEISYSGLAEADKSEDWLKERLKISSDEELENVILATYDSEKDELTAHLKDGN